MPRPVVSLGLVQQLDVALVALIAASANLWWCGRRRAAAWLLCASFVVRTWLQQPITALLPVEALPPFVDLLRSNALRCAFFVFAALVGASPLSFREGTAALLAVVAAWLVQACVLYTRLGRADAVVVALLPWDARCSWAGCGGCTECGAESECKPFCEDKTQAWDDKCTWEGCNGCSECGAESECKPFYGPVGYALQLERLL
ncbi:hypothetical protein EMIHUDRAFT_220254 [Emiliania huxleyi CCMP1516]|uniref:4Fe-4S ferredoxin-type domain-containing protein n=2 Tax=Emiliania huxleyi TaxID=2903 RepID=A0A0D3I1L4_EMIH1|nr:hypothetical protein EMIHUDRAFT_220254 [Emiliania huxleyi CCMP1516]EOD05149.1 hypothetical protein EMIHUDRAFT_220254 [Emiliania huxleyi CCMP1516]|eukprot:XP_005757578.1 hypothetical protein EMIHUDRAFT_220254 [Emiliania huxleyi CCMP1516]